MRANYTRVKGRSILGWVIVSPFILMALTIVLIIVGVLLCETNKAYWDYQVKNMCEKDGGVFIYEEVSLTREEYNRYGGIGGTITAPGEDSSVAHRYRYLSKRSSIVVRSSYPKVIRYESVIYRVDDKKILGKMVTYYRNGGDFPTVISPGTSFSCKDILNFNLDIEREIFSIKENRS